VKTRRHHRIPCLERDDLLAQGKVPEFDGLVLTAGSQCLSVWENATVQTLSLCPIRVEVSGFGVTLQSLTVLFGSFSESRPLPVARVLPSAEKATE